MAVTIKKLYQNQDGKVQFVDLVSACYDDSVQDTICKSLCEQFGSNVLGIYCIDMEQQIILHKWVWNAQAETPAAVKVW